jgi:hypothetical protein
MKRKRVCLATAFDTEAGKNAIQGAYLRETALKQIQSDESGEQQKIFADEQRTDFHTQCQ